MYRVPAANAGVRQRRNQLRHPATPGMSRALQGIGSILGEAVGFVLSCQGTSKLNGIGALL
jgi:hypothetical protein